MFSSRFGEVRSDWRGGLLEVVRGNRLLPALPEPLVIGIALPPFPSRLVGLNGIGPPIALRCRTSRSIRYAWDCVERVLVGVGGID